MDIQRTREFYDRLGCDAVCDCAYCQNYVRQIREEYPAVADYLRELGVDIEKPFETMPLEPEPDGYIEYIGAQYIVCGKPEGFEAAVVGAVRVGLAESHPSTRVEEPHFVIEIDPIRLKWVMPPLSGL